MVYIGHLSSETLYRLLARETAHALSAISLRASGRHALVANVTDWLSFVTGISSGLGRTLAQELLRRGWEVIGMVRRLSAINHEKYHHLQLDLRDIGSIRPSFQQVGNTLQLAKRQRVGLVNNAASPGQFGALEALKPYALHHLPLRIDPIMLIPYEDIS
jgi:hypothetical protein